MRDRILYPWLATIVVVCFVCGPIHAHEVRPTLLHLSQETENEFSVLWKVPARGAAVLKLEVQFPSACTPLTPPRHVRSSAASVRQWQIRCASDLSGQTTTIRGLETTAVETIVRIDWRDRPSQNVRLTGGENSFVVSAQTTVADAARSYVPFGMTHIWFGVDHLLFLVALLLLIGSVRQMILAVTSFTVAHSITLGLAVLGVVSVPSGLVEALIALSIVFVAAEALKDQAAQPTLARRQPWAIAFAFGLLHGLGFAGALTSAGLPQDAIVPALLFFNIGVELGQIAFVGGLLSILFLIRLAGARNEHMTRQAALYGAGIAGAFWTIERSASLFGVVSV